MFDVKHRDLSMVSTRIGSLTDVADSVLTLYVVFDHPTDFPNTWVVRQQHVTRAGVEMGDFWVGPSLEAVRSLLPPGLHRMDRSPNDDPKIAEVWL